MKTEIEKTIKYEIVILEGRVLISSRDLCIELVMRFIKRQGSAELQYCQTVLRTRKSGIPAFALDPCHTLQVLWF